MVRLVFLLLTNDNSHLCRIQEQQIPLIPIHSSSAVYIIQTLIWRINQIE